MRTVRLLVSHTKNLWILLIKRYSTSHIIRRLRIEVIILLLFYLIKILTWRRTRRYLTQMERENPTWTLDTMILNNISALNIVKSLGDICVIKTFGRVIVCIIASNIIIIIIVVVIIITEPINIDFTFIRILLNL